MTRKLLRPGGRGGLEANDEGLGRGMRDRWVRVVIQFVSLTDRLSRRDLIGKGWAVR